MGRALLPNPAACSVVKAPTAAATCDLDGRRPLVDSLGPRVLHSRRHANPTLTAPQELADARQHFFLPRSLPRSVPYQYSAELSTYDSHMTCWLSRPRTRSATRSTAAERLSRAAAAA